MKTRLKIFALIRLACAAVVNINAQQQVRTALPEKCLTASPPDVRRGSAPPVARQKEVGLGPSYGLWPMIFGGLARTRGQAHCITTQPAGRSPASHPAAKPLSTFRAKLVRTEKDLLGEKTIPADAYYGVQTARALENFKLSGVLINHYPGFVEAWAVVKLAAARANAGVGAMKPDEAYKSGKGILEIIREKKILTEPQIKELLDPIKLTNLDKSKYQGKN